MLPSASLYGKLPVDSYTAKRLTDATPEHLHQTSRRLFIGPIPQGWIGSHRKSWVNTRVKRNFRARAATFTAEENTSRQRRVSGLGEESDSQRFHASFPQPRNVEQADEQAVAEPEPSASDDHPTNSSREDDGAAAASHVVERAGQEDSEEGIIASPADLSPIQRAKLEILPPSQGPQRQSTDERHLSPLDSTPGASSLAPDVHRTGATSSTTSLLHKSDETIQPEAAGVVKTTKPQRSILSKSGPRKTGCVNPNGENNAEEEDDDDDNDEGDDLPKPHIRFNIEQEGTKKALLKRARMGQSQLRNGIEGALKRRMTDGTIIKMEKMLVRIDETANVKLPDEYDENTSQGVVSTIKEKWREYMIVVRQKGSKGGAEYVLQAYKSRVIPASEKGQKKRPQFEILLQSKHSHLNMYSSLDKSLVLWTSSKHGTLIYMLQSRAISSSVEWLTFLRGIYGLHRPSELMVTIPEVDINVRLEDPFKALEPDEDDEMIDGKDNDDFDDERAMAKAVAREAAVAPTIVHRCLSILKTTPDSADMLETWQHGQRLGLAWKRYDRLEWIHGVQQKKMFGTMAMTQTHDLELRPKEHYPVTAKTKKGKTLHEPPPVEGFLIQLTSQKGQQKKLGRNYFHRLYFASFDQFLIITQPKRAEPPAPPDDTIYDESYSSKNISEATPIIYAVNPFPVEDDKIKWLGHSTLQSIKAQNEIAEEEAARKEKLLQNCDGLINLVDVIKVRKVHHDADEVVVKHDDAEESDSEDETSAQNEGQIGSDDSKTFELVLKNGLIMRLRAYDKHTKKEWKKRLRALVKYWRWRHVEDLQLFHQVRSRNLQQLQVDEEGEAWVGQFARKWELNSTYASPEMYNMCGISGCRTVYLSGSLYTKPRLHGHFTLNHCLLMSGHMLLFESSLRAKSGKVIKHTHHTRKQIIDLGDTYLYTGLLTEGDLLYHNTTFDANSPGHHALPRMWTEDNWDNWDEDIMTCFVLWKPSGKSWFRDESQGSRAKLKRVSTLGKKGNKIVFRARSRAERDRWVLAIAAEIERQEAKEDVRVVGEADQS